jgi:hypothetical protein
MRNGLDAEIARRLTNGCERVSFDELQRRIDALGYRLDRRMDCYSIARDVRTGESYPCITGYAREKDTGLSFAHFSDARRDAAYRGLQNLRGRVFAVVRGAIYDA